MDPHIGALFEPGGHFQEARGFSPVEDIPVRVKLSVEFIKFFFRISRPNLGQSI